MTDSPGRVLALDVGTVRVGVALSDPGRTIAFPAGKLARKALRANLDPILRIVREQGVDTVVVGHPRLLSGEIGTRAKDAEAFASRLAEAAGVAVVLWDERLTSVQANRALIEGDVRRARRRDAVDATAAALLLQSWLDAQAARAART